MLRRLAANFIEVLSRTITDYECDLTHQAHRKATMETLDFIEQNNLAGVLNLPGNTKLYTILPKRLGDGIIIEFGVNKGKSINDIATLLPDRMIFGFDTFTGLPEDWVILPKGAFDLGGKMPEVAKNVKLIKGLIQDTLPSFTKDNYDKIAFIHIDTDLYSAAKAIFEGLEDRIKDTFILFDEYWNFPNWQQEEYKAFMEFISETGKKFEYVAYHGKTSVLVRVF